MKTWRCRRISHTSQVDPDDIYFETHPKLKLLKRLMDSLQQFLLRYKLLDPLLVLQWQSMVATVQIASRTFTYSQRSGLPAIGVHIPSKLFNYKHDYSRWQVQTP